MPTRALIIVRLSRVTDATTSPERQRADCDRFCRAYGMDVVGVAEDTDVSGSIDPQARPALGPWLRDRMDEFDVVVAAKLDRIGRNARHIHKLMEHLNNAGKNLRCANDSTEIESATGRMVVYIMGTLAEMELDSIRERNASAAKWNIEHGKYRGGLPPVGYRSVRDDTGDWRITPDEEGSAPVLREIVSRVLAGERFAAIAQDLNRRDVPTHKDRQDQLHGRSPRGRGWTVSNLSRMLSSPSLLGHVVYREAELGPDGKPKRTESGDKVYGPERTLYRDGEPVLRTETPVIPPEDYYRLQNLIAQRRDAEPGQRRTAEPSLLTQVLFCGWCGAPMWRLKGGPGRANRYRCGSVQGKGSCGNKSVTMHKADEYATDAVLSILEGVPYVQREYVGGQSNVVRIAEIDAQLINISKMVTVLTPDTPAFDAQLDTMQSLNAERETLAAEPEVESGYQYVDTGETFEEMWNRVDNARRNDFLREHGIRLDLDLVQDGEPTFRLHMDGVLSMVESVFPGEVAEVREKLRTVGMDGDDPGAVLSTMNRRPSGQGTS